jgi:hypothetical protein
VAQGLGEWGKVFNGVLAALVRNRRGEGVVIAPTDDISLFKLRRSFKQQVYSVYEVFV